MDPIPHENAPVTDRYQTYEQMNLINSFRTSSLEMAIFSRFVASCIIIYEDCFDALFARLLQVPAEIFQQWTAYMGRSTAEKYYNLLTQHIIIMVELLQAIKAGNQQEADRLLVNWYKNADEISDFMASVNPYWSKEQLQNLFYQDLQLTLSQAQSLMAKDYIKSVEIFDQLRFHSILIGDTVARGFMQLLLIRPPVVTPSENAAVPEAMGIPEAHI